MKYNTTHGDTQLELRVLELEDTVATLCKIVSTMNSMIGTLNEAVSTYADTLGGLVLSLPSTVRKSLIWPTVAALAEPGCGRACPDCAPTDKPTD